MYSVSVARRAEKDLARLHPAVLAQVHESIAKLRLDPRPNGCRKVLATEGVWRIRVGDYRIGYTIDDSETRVKVVRVDHRSAFYD